MRLGNLTNRINDNKFQINAEENMFANRIKTLLKIKNTPKESRRFLFRVYTCWFCSTYNNKSIKAR